MRPPNYPPNYLLNYDNNTIVNNFASFSGGGFKNGHSHGIIRNSIIWGNDSNLGPQIYVIGTLFAIEYSMLQGGEQGIEGPGDFDWGPGMIDADPLFFAAASGDYHLSPGSPCIDAGNNLAVPEGVVSDLDGGPRFLDDPDSPDTGNPDPDAPELPIVDMGPYEYDPDDCNHNNVPDEGEPDCNVNGFPDDCDIAAGTSPDCNSNAVPDECESDTDGDGTPDECDNCALFNPDQADCQPNGIGDVCDIADGTSNDCDATGIPDECETDCNGNGVADSCDIADGTSEDCNTNAIPDECEPDCNGNGQQDDCDIADGTSEDCNTNAIPDDCELDCNDNDVPDDCDIADGTSEDCNANDIPDDCEPDCNGNGQADSCDIADGSSEDCNANAIPDDCEPDCNGNGQADACDITEGSSDDCNGDEVPDECVDPLPILQQPQNQAVPLGEMAFFNVVVDGVLPEYQWRKDGMDLQDSERIFGSGSAVLIILKVMPEDAGEYDCLIIDLFGCEVVSNAATLTVLPRCPADFDDDGTVGASDLAFLLGAWGPNPNHPADLDADGIIDASDLAILLGAWGPCQ